LTLLTEKAPKLDPLILILPPIDLCSLLPLLAQGVNHVPSEPEKQKKRKKIRNLSMSSVIP